MGLIKTIEQLYSLFDGGDDFTRPQRVISLASHVLEKMDERTITFPPRYLALGAGRARAERTFAQSLSIPNHLITLVDKQFNHRFELKAIGINLIEGVDFFTYLENVVFTEKFGLVTGFGIDYRLNHPDNVQKLANSLPYNLLPNALIIFYKYTHLKRDAVIWRNNGFHFFIDPNLYKNAAFLQFKQ